jgi:hypothetical protein
MQQIGQNIKKKVPGVVLVPLPKKYLDDDGLFNLKLINLYLS